MPGALFPSRTFPSRASADGFPAFPLLPSPMSYEVIARKWRPQKFSEVVGQPHLVRTLLNALSTGRIAHAYLFVGPRGTGKTSTARLLAKALNCQHLSDTHEPCGECDSCREIASATSLDVIEIDAASNTGVDSIRDLREKVRYAPARGPYKIYIIDEVHMLSIGAFNALLKTLEEPPEHAKFILATTDVQKVPTTILSRCQRFDLRRIRLPDILSRLEEICAAEHWYVDPAALLAVARGAEGGLRDAESALDQLVSFRGTTITEADALDVFGLASWDVISSLAHDLLAGDVAHALTTLSRLDAAGRDLPRVLQELLGSFRNLLVLLYAPELAETFDLTAPQQESLKALAKLTDGEKLLRVVEILSAAAIAFSNGSNDAQKSMGIITLALFSGGFIAEFEVPMYVKILCASAMAIGTATGGWRIIKTVGGKIFKLEPPSGFAADLNSSCVVFGATLLTLPVSTTHVVSGSIMGVGTAKRLNAVRWGVAQNMVKAWAITIPITAIMGAIAYGIVEIIF